MADANKTNLGESLLISVYLPLSLFLSKCASSTIKISGDITLIKSWLGSLSIKCFKKSMEQILILLLVQIVFPSNFILVLSTISEEIPKSFSRLSSCHCVINEAGTAIRILVSLFRSCTSLINLHIIGDLPIPASCAM